MLEALGLLILVAVGACLALFGLIALPLLLVGLVLKLVLFVVLLPLRILGGVCLGLVGLAAVAAKLVIGLFAGLAICLMLVGGVLLVPLLPLLLMGLGIALLVRIARPRRAVGAATP